MNSMVEVILKTLRPARAAVAALGVLALAAGPAGAQTLVPDDPGIPAEDRTPLVFIHGLCGSPAVWTGEGGLASLIRLQPELNARFKLYHFAYDTAPGPLADAMDCGDDAPDHTAGRAADLGRALDRALASEPGVGPERPVAIVAHSFGGLVARSFMQAEGGAGRTAVLITLATPHHGIPGLDDPDGALSALRPDGHAQSARDNAWLACLNGLAAEEDACDQAAAARRDETFGRTVAIGLVRPSSLGEKRPDDGLVPISSALLEGAALAGRYQGLGGQEGGSGCTAHPLAHQAILDADCLVEAAPASGGGAEPLLAVVARALDEAGGEPRGLMEDALFHPDLRTSQVGFLGTVAQPGGTLQVFVRIDNDGVVGSADATTRFYVSADTVSNSGDKLLTGTHVSHLSAGSHIFASVITTVPASIAPGDYYVIACADDLKRVQEMSETNNCAASSQKVTITRPNVRVETLSNPPSTAAPGMSFHVTSSTKNVGSVPLLKATFTRFYFSLNNTKGSGDRLLTGSDNVGLLAAGDSDPGSLSLIIPSATPPGTYYLLGCADDTKQVTETNENDNCKASTTQIQVGTPDVAVIAISSPPAVIQPGGSFSALATITNAGTGPAATNKLRYYFSVDTVRNAGDKLLGGVFTVGTLPPGFFDQFGGNVTVPANMPVGIYRLLACVDDLKELAESSEANNCGAAVGTINVTRPDLVVNTVYTVGDASVPPGGLLTVHDTNQNLGLVGVGPTTTKYWLSLNNTKGSGDIQLVGSRLVPLVGAQGVQGDQVQVTVSLNTNPGSYYVIACADVLNDVVELNETNNCKATDTANVTITP